MIQYFPQMNREMIMAAADDEDPSRIYKLELSSRNILQICSLAEFAKIRCLILNFNFIKRIQNLQSLPDLRELQLESNELQRIEGLESNKNLQVLNLAHNQIEKIENISQLSKLETLLLDHNCVTKVAGFEYSKELKTLSLKHNRIESLDNLPAFSKLATLVLSFNKINAIPQNFFLSSKSLVNLDLSHNRLESTAFLMTLANLEILNLSHNKIGDLQIPIMANLQSLDLSHNQIQKLPLIGPCFPELISLNIAHNLICCEIEVISSLAEASSLTEFDFRDNPMFNLTFQSSLEKIHNFDFLNGKVMTKAGAKYYDQVNRIQVDLLENSHFYDADDEDDRKIKMSGFYDEELEFKMSGLKANRPNSPIKKKKNLEKATFYEDIDRTYHEIIDNDRKIKAMRHQYLKICDEYSISSHITEPEIAAESKKTLEEAKRSELPSDPLARNESELKRQNETNLNKWKELKQREKSFNIRDVIKKSRGRDSSTNKNIGSLSNSNWNVINSTSFRPERLKNELLKTQALPKKSEELLKTFGRPSSTRRKE